MQIRIWTKPCSCSQSIYASLGMITSNLLTIELHFHGRFFQLKLQVKKLGWKQRKNKRNKRITNRIRQEGKHHSIQRTSKFKFSCNCQNTERCKHTKEWRTHNATKRAKTEIRNNQKTMLNSYSFYDKTRVGFTIYRASGNEKMVLGFKSCELVMWDVNIHSGNCRSVSLPLFRGLFIFGPSSFLWALLFSFFFLFHP